MTRIWTDQDGFFYVWNRECTRIDADGYEWRPWIEVLPGGRNTTKPHFSAAKVARNAENAVAMAICSQLPAPSPEEAEEFF